MTEHGEAIEEAAPRRRRRRSAKSQPEPVSLIDRIKGKAFGRMVFAIMCIVAAAHSFSSYRQVAAAREGYGPVRLGQRVDDLAGVLGKPLATTEAGSSSHVADGRLIELKFDPVSRRIGEVSCRERAITAVACPRHLGIALGASKTSVLREFGPAVTTAGPDRQVLQYPTIGSRIELVDEKVSAIGLSAKRDGRSPWPIVLW